MDSETPRHYVSITDFDTPWNGNLGDVPADSALEEPRRATK